MNGETAMGTALVVGLVVVLVVVVGILRVGTVGDMTIGIEKSRSNIGIFTTSVMDMECEKVTVVEVKSSESVE